MTFAEIALKIANMLAMLTHHAGRLKMPRPAAYGRRPISAFRIATLVAE